MSNVIYAVLSRQAALEREFDSVANNIANASTTGFRSERRIFSEYVNAIAGEPSLSQTRDAGRALDLGQGELVATGGPFDLAIDGRGFFVVDTPLGARLTRSGAFVQDAGGLLTTREGFPVHGAGGGPIAIPRGAGPIVVSSDGVLSANGAVFGRIRIADADPASLARETGALFRTVGEIVEIEAAVRQGFLEASNVSPVTELSRMIEVQRAYELSAQMLAEEGRRMERAIETLGGRR